MSGIKPLPGQTEYTPPTSIGQTGYTQTPSFGQTGIRPLPGQTGYTPPTSIGQPENTQTPSFGQTGIKPLPGQTGYTPPTSIGQPGYTKPQVSFPDSGPIYSGIKPITGHDITNKEIEAKGYSQTAEQTLATARVAAKTAAEYAANARTAANNVAKAAADLNRLAQSISTSTNLADMAEKATEIARAAEEAATAAQEESVIAAKEAENTVTLVQTVIAASAAVRDAGSSQPDKQKQETENAKNAMNTAQTTASAAQTAASNSQSAMKAVQDAVNIIQNMTKTAFAHEMRQQIRFMRKHGKMENWQVQQIMDNVTHTYDKNAGYKLVISEDANRIEVQIPKEKAEQMINFVSALRDSKFIDSYDMDEKQKDHLRWAMVGAATWGTIRPNTSCVSGENIDLVYRNAYKDVPCEDGQVPIQDYWERIFLFAVAKEEFGSDYMDEKPWFSGDKEEYQNLEDLRGLMKYTLEQVIIDNNAVSTLLDEMPKCNFIIYPG